jgi:hypothetical protein
MQTLEQRESLPSLSDSFSRGQRWFPTRVRATGAGISFNSGRVLAGAVVLSSGALVQLLGGDYAWIGLGSGMIYVVGMAIIWLAPARPADAPRE